MSRVEKFEAMLKQGQDNAMLRYTLGNEYLKQHDAQRAITHLQAAVEHDAHYSAAWKALGRALHEAERYEESIRAYTKGIEVAEVKGDKQLVKEMTVFRRRVEKLL